MPATRSAHRPLLDLAPAIPWVELALLPTPLSYVGTLPSSAPLLLKNDGECAPFYGGNKVRKLEFLLADALDKGYTRVATIGAVGSNHALATATWAKKLGMSCEVLHFDQQPTEHVRQTLGAISSQGAVLHPIGGQRDVPAALALWKARFRARIGDERTYFVAGGGSSNVGSLGYVNAGLEFALQIVNSPLPAPSTIRVAAGTSGTLAGLILGLALARLTAITVIGVRVTDAVVSNRIAVRRLLYSTSRLLEQHGVRIPAALPDWRLDHAQFAPGYGVPTPASEKAVAVARELLGLHLENTYTGRAFASLLGDATTGPHLYWHTLNQRPLDALTRHPLPALPDAYAPYL
jgi:1-aminocyclopropane-1-carboxylate deaminase/D-cysteine desulfhydrase-like pyridoxal-dependent ACC family enzyme